MSRQAASEVVFDVCEKGRSLDEALARHAQSVPLVDAGMFQDISYGAVRWYLAYEHYINQHLKKPLKPKDRILKAVLVTAMYQLDYTKHAEHAIVNEAVSMSKALKRDWAKGLINAILRGYIRLKDKPIHHQPSWIESSFPNWMREKIKHDWPQQGADILAASQVKPPMTLRVNTQNISVAAYLQRLDKENISAQFCQDSEVGVTLEKPVAVTKLIGFDQADVSVQDESAQLAVTLLDLMPKQRVLDACAAPGGKTLHILESQADVEALFALDLTARLPRLHENIKRANAPVMVVDGSLLGVDSWWDKNPFDRILLDVPCTGTGVIRRHPDIKLRRQPQDTQQFAQQQLELLNHAWTLLKANGKLLYTSCSIFPQENDQCINTFLAESKDAQTVKLPEKLGLKTKHGYQRLPGVHSGDGFYYALLKKT